MFRWNGFAAYLFDIDGTLLNSRDGVHYNAFHSALRETFATDIASTRFPCTATPTSASCAP